MACTIRSNAYAAPTCWPASNGCHRPLFQRRFGARQPGRQRYLSRMPTRFPGAVVPKGKFTSVLAEKYRNIP